MAEHARALDYYGGYNHGTAAPKRAIFEQPFPEPQEMPAQNERLRQRERESASRSAAAAKAAGLAGSPSVFATLGAVLAGAMMIFVLLGLISFNEISAETARLNEQLAQQTERHRKLEIEFESVIDMKEVERYARDELGMSKPETSQITVIHSVPSDKIEIVPAGDGSPLNGLGAFLSSLLEYLKFK